MKVIAKMLSLGLPILIVTFYSNYFQFILIAPLEELGHKPI
jgi:hypothetical protein